MVGAITATLVFRPEAVSTPILSGVAVAITLFAASAIGRPGPLVVWNMSPSIPTGLYGVGWSPPHVGDMILARLPFTAAVLADSRGYLPRSAHLIKPVVATAGYRVCRHSVRILVEDRLVAFAQPADRIGRPLPVWGGCRLLRVGEVFVIADDPQSFDSRYFGPLARQHVVGRAFQIW